jgi:Flp pilus assembly protein TadG
MRLYRSIQRLRRDERGVSMIFSAFAITGIMFAAGISIDLSRYFVAKSRLQASVQQAALAGATNFWPYIDSASQVRAAANAVLTANATLTLMTTSAASISLRCSTELKSNTLKYIALKNATATCTNVNQANVVSVQQSATVNLAFGKFLKINSLGINARSEAVPYGSLTSSVKKPVNLAVVVDTTASMSTTDNNCKDANGTKLSRLNCVKMGLSYLFNGLAGADAQIQLLTFPPIDAAGDVGNEVCNPKGTVNITNNYGVYTPGAGPTSGPYGSNNEDYTVLPKAAAGGPPTAVSTKDSNFMSAPGQMKTTSDFYKVLGAYAAGDSKPIATPACTGLQNPGGVGTYYGDALAWARNNLSYTNDGTRQDVIVLLSDGQANSSDLPKTAPDSTNFKSSSGAVSNVVKNLTLNGVSGGGVANNAAYGIQNTKTTAFTTPGTNSFPGVNGSCVSGATYCGKTTNTYVTCTTSSGKCSTFKDECKAAAQYADQLAEFKPNVNKIDLETPMIYSYFYGDGTGTNGCDTDTDKTYTSCYTMKKIASDTDKFFSVDSTCSGNNGQVVDISAAFGQLAFDLTGTTGRSRTIPWGM